MSSVRWCNHCEREKDEGEFRKPKGRFNGICRVCERFKHRVWWRNRYHRDAAFRRAERARAIVNRRRSAA